MGKELSPASRGVHYTRNVGAALDESDFREVLPVSNASRFAANTPEWPPYTRGDVGTGDKAERPKS